MADRLILQWEASGIRYRLTATGPERREAMIVAVGPGTRMRVSQRILDGRAIAQWLGMETAPRTAAAESLLDEGSIGA